MMIVLPVVPVVYCSQLWMDEQQALNWMDAVMKPSVGLMGGFKPDGQTKKPG